MDNTLLFSPITMGDLTLKNRIVMAPLTRSRASDDHVPSELAIEYYQQRASCGLIITEGTSPSPDGEGYPRTPGLYNDEQVKAWQKITSAIHQRGGKVFVQLMHAGRIAHPLNKAKGTKTVAPSAIKAENLMMYTDEQGLLEVATPEALTLEGIQGVIDDYKNATKLAFEAGFDGVELHGANGYLPMQFLSTNANKRVDLYGGPAQNRIRFVVELLEAMIEVAGAKKVGIRLSPGSVFNDIYDDAPIETYTLLLQAVNKLTPAYVHVVGQAMNLAHKPQFNKAIGFDVYKLVRENYSGLVIANCGFELKSANDAINDNTADLISFGQKFIANPDLVERFKQNATLNTPNPETYYTPGAKGYTDYPVLSKS